jgi:hypothetical protein
MQIGDNPSVTTGVPITIGCDRCSSYKLNLDNFEFARPARDGISRSNKYFNMDRGRIQRPRETLKLARVDNSRSRNESMIYSRD